jgi:hypothetical protein
MMKTFLHAVLALALLLGMALGLNYLTRPAFAIPMQQHGLAKTPAIMNSQATRACMYQTGGWTTVDCSAGAAYSTELNEWSRYVIQCESNARWAPTSVGSGADADSADGYAPQGAWFDFFTTDVITYYSCDASALGGGKCRHIECK